MSEPLESCVFTTGTKFVVTDKYKNNNLGPFSIGFMSYVMQYHHIPNLVSSRVVIIRKGKRGKVRLWPTDILTNIFDIGEIKNEGNMKNLIHIERAFPLQTNVFRMNPSEFIGWGISHTRSLRYIYENEETVSRRWPESQQNSINLIDNSPNEFRQRPGEVLELYSSPVLVGDFVLRLREMEASINRPILLREKGSTRNKLVALAYLIFENLSNKHKQRNIDILINAYNENRDRFINIDNSVLEFDKKINVTYNEWLKSARKKYFAANAGPRQGRRGYKQLHPVGIGILIEHLEKCTSGKTPIGDFAAVVFNPETLKKTTKKSKTDKNVPEPPVLKGMGGKIRSATTDRGSYDRYSYGTAATTVTTTRRWGSTF